MCNEVEFSSPVKVQLIRIVKPGTDVHQQVKQLKTITDKDGQFKSLEIFYKDLSSPSAKYTLLVNAKLISETKILSHDVLVPLPESIFTDHIVLRGDYVRLTVCIYGESIESKDCSIALIEPNFSLDLLPRKQQLDEDNEKKRRVVESGEDLRIARLENARKLESNIFQKGNFHISFEQILPRLLCEKQEQSSIGEHETQVARIYTLVGEVNQLSGQNDEEVKQNLHVYRQNLEALTKEIHTRREESESHSRSDRFIPTDKKERNKKYQSYKTDRKESRRSRSRSHSPRSRDDHRSSRKNRREDSHHRPSRRSDKHRSHRRSSRSRSVNSRSPSRSHSHRRSPDRPSRKSVKSRNQREDTLRSGISSKREKTTIKQNDLDKRAAKEQSQPKSTLVNMSYEKTLERGYQIILFEMSSQTSNEQLLRGYRQILHKAMMSFYLSKIEQILSVDLPFLAEANPLDYSKQRLNLNAVQKDLNESLDGFTNILKEQTLVNGRRIGGSSFDLPFEDTFSRTFYSEKKRSLQKFSTLQEVIKADIHTLTNQNIRFFAEQKLFPSLLVILSSPLLRSSSEFVELFSSCYRIISHMLECRGSILMFSESKEVLKVLIQVLENLQIPLQMSQKAESCSDDFFISENSFSGSFCSNIGVSDWQSVINLPHKLQASIESSQILQVSILAKQLSGILKYFVQLVNIMNQVYVKLMANENDLEMVQLLAEISKISTKSSISAIALNKFLNNDFSMDALFTLFSISNLDQLLEKQIEVSIICETFYNALLFDSGVLTILHSSQILLNLISINDILGENQHRFEANRELRKYAILLINYMLPMEIFMDESKRGLTTLISELKKKSGFLDEEEKSLKAQLELHYNADKQLNAREFRDTFLKLGNLDEPNQNLIFIDVSLKILNLIVSYNKNILLTFSESGLLSNIDYLAKCLTSLITYLTQKTMSSEGLFKRFATKGRLVNQYSSVLKKAMGIISARFQLRVAIPPITAKGIQVGNNRGGSGPSAAAVASSNAVMMAMMAMSSQSGSMSAGNIVSQQLVGTEKQLLCKYDEFFVEQIQMAISLLTAGYQLTRNSLELNIAGLDKSNWQAICQSTLLVLSSLFTQPTKDQMGALATGIPVNDSQILLKFQQRIEKAFSFIQQRLYSRAEDRPALLYILTAIIKLSRIKRSTSSQAIDSQNRTVLQAFLKPFEFARLLELPSLMTHAKAIIPQSEDSKQEIKEEIETVEESLLDTILRSTLLLKSELVRKELTCFLEDLLGLVDRETTQVISERILSILLQYVISTREFISKSDRKEIIYAYESRKEREWLRESFERISRILKHLSCCCRNGCFKGEFLYKHGDNELLRLLALTRSIDETLCLDNDISDAIRIVRTDVFHIFGVLFDIDIGYAALVRSTGSQIPPSNLQSLVEDIPQISIKQELFENIDINKLSFPESIIKVQSTQPDDQDEQIDFEQGDSSEPHQQEDSRSFAVYTRLDEINAFFDILVASSKNVVGSTVLLYNDYVTYGYKSNPAVRLSPLTVQLLTRILPARGISISSHTVTTLKILAKYLFVVASLTFHPLTSSLLLEEKRKNAIKVLLVDDQLLLGLGIDICESNGNSKTDESGRILEQLFCRFQEELDGFCADIHQKFSLSINPPTSSEQQILKDLINVYQKCRVLLQYLSTYSGQIEEKVTQQKLSPEGNPNLPTEIRQPSECFSQVDTAMSQPPSQNSGTIDIMFKFIHQFTQSIIVDAEEMEPLKYWQEMRFNSIFNGFYSFARSRVADDATLYTNALSSDRDSSLEYRSLWDADCEESLSKKYFDTKASKNLKTKACSIQYYNYQKQPSIFSSISTLTALALAQFDQVDKSPSSLSYTSYGKWDSQANALNELNHLLKKRIFRESIQRTPLTRHILDIVKASVRKAPIISTTIGVPQIIPSQQLPNNFTPGVVGQPQPIPQGGVPLSHMPQYPPPNQRRIPPGVNVPQFQNHPERFSGSQMDPRFSQQQHGMPLSYHSKPSYPMNIISNGPSQGYPYLQHTPEKPISEQQNTPISHLTQHHDMMHHQMVPPNQLLPHQQSLRQYPLRSVPIGPPGYYNGPPGIPPLREQPQISQHFQQPQMIQNNGQPFRPGSPIRNANLNNSSQNYYSQQPIHPSHMPGAASTIPVQQIHFNKMIQPPPPPPPVIPPPPPPQGNSQTMNSGDTIVSVQTQITQTSTSTQGLSNISSLTFEEKRIFQEKIEEIKQLQKNKGDPRSAKKVQAILNEYPKLLEIINKSKQPS